MNRIKELRNFKNITQQELAKYLGVSDRSIGYYENEKRDPDTKTLAKLSDYFQVSIDYLLGRDDVKLRKKIYINEFNVISTEGLNSEDIKIIEKIVEHILKSKQIELNYHKEN